MTFDAVAVLRWLGGASSAHIVAEHSGRLERQDGVSPGRRRRFVFFGRHVESRRAACAYAREYGGTVFGPRGEVVDSFGPCKYET